MKRAYATLLQEYLSFFPCVVIVGPRQCGKTTFLSELSNKWKIFDLERASDYQLVSRDPDLFFRLNPAQIAIDESQMLPSLFPAIRVAIDQDRGHKGRFVLTGSSSPSLIHSISESLAGRVGIIELAPFSCSEALESHSPGLWDWFEHPTSIQNLSAQLKPARHVKDVHAYWFKGGYPEPWLNSSIRFRNAWMDNYIQTYIQRDIAALFPGLNHDRFRQLVTILAGLSGTVINYSDIARNLGISSPTVRDYFEILHGTFLWRQIPAFEHKALRRLVRHPRGYLRDSGLLHFLLRIAQPDDLQTHPKMGASWEGMVTEELLRGLNCRGISHQYFYYRTGAGAEIDLVLEGDFGLVPIEIKYTQAADFHQVKNLKNFIDEFKCRAGFVITNDVAARKFDEKILGIPFNHII